MKEGVEPIETRIDQDFGKWILHWRMYNFKLVSGWNNSERSWQIEKESHDVRSKELATDFLDLHQT